MGAEFVVIFISIVMLVCGIVLLFSEGGAKRVGFYLLLIGIIGIFLCVVAYPREQVYNTYQYDQL